MSKEQLHYWWSSWWLGYPGSRGCSHAQRAWPVATASGSGCCSLPGPQTGPCRPGLDEHLDRLDIGSLENMFLHRAWHIGAGGTVRCRH